MTEQERIDHLKAIQENMVAQEQALSAVIADMEASLPPVVTPPTVTFTVGPTSGVAPLLVNVAYTGSPADRIAWTFGDGATATGLSASHTYAGPGTFTLTCTATNSAGSSSANASISVTAPVPPTNPFPTPGGVPVNVLSVEPFDGGAVIYVAPPTDSRCQDLGAIQWPTHHAFFRGGVTLSPAEGLPVFHSGQPEGNGDYTFTGPRPQDTAPFVGLCVNGVPSGGADYVLFWLDNLAPAEFEAPASPFCGCEQQFGPTEEPPDPGTDTCPPLALNQPICADVMVVNGQGLNTNPLVVGIGAPVHVVPGTKEPMQEDVLYEDFSAPFAINDIPTDPRENTDDPGSSRKILGLGRLGMTFYRVKTVAGRNKNRRRHHHCETLLVDDQRETQVFSGHNKDMGGDAYSNAYFDPDVPLVLDGTKVACLRFLAPGKTTDRDWLQIAVYEWGTPLYRNDWHNRSNADGSPILPFGLNVGLMWNLRHDRHELYYWAGGPFVRLGDSLLAARATPYAPSMDQSNHRPWCNGYTSDRNRTKCFEVRTDGKRIQLIEQDQVRVDAVLPTPLPYTKLLIRPSSVLYHSKLRNDNAVNPPPPARRIYTFPEPRLVNAERGVQLTHWNRVQYGYVGGWK